MMDWEFEVSNMVRELVMGGNMDEVLRMFDNESDEECRNRIGIEHASIRLGILLARRPRTSEVVEMLSVWRERKAQWKTWISNRTGSSAVLEKS